MPRSASIFENPTCCTEALRGIEMLAEADGVLLPRVLGCDRVRVHTHVHTHTHGNIRTSKALYLVTWKLQWIPDEF